MIYVDTSVVLAHLLAEDERPPDALWDDVLIASRLVEYETWVRLNAGGLAASHAAAARATLGRLRFIELSPTVLDRARDPFPVSVRTLDALHLATFAYAYHQFGGVALATYDERLRRGASALNLPLHVLEPGTERRPRDL